MRKALLPFLVAVAALLLAACRHAPPNLNSPGHTIVVLGDSLAAGVGSGPGEAYPDLLATQLKTAVVNAGISGNTTADGLARIGDVLAEDPWLVVVELGGNDILRQVPPEQTERNLRAILDRLITGRVVPVLVEVDAPFAARYREIYGRLGDEYHVPIVEDVFGEVLRDPALKSDQIHPNAEGQRRLAQAIAEELQPILDARRKAR